jgi:probable F420-dependent oxidoreductase
VKVRIAVSPGGGPWSTESYLSLVDGLEERGFDTIWLSDVPLAPTMDPTVGLAFAAARTRRLKLGANVVPIGRHPMLLSKELAQIDQLSGGRLLLMMVPGLGSPAERESLGVLAADRGAYLDEVVPLLRRFWSGEEVEHHSERFSFPGVAVRPRPVQDPLEVWLGGMGPRALLRAGRLADGWLGAALTPGEAGAARARIEKAAADAGRAFDPEHFGLSIAYARGEPSPIRPHCCRSVATASGTSSALWLAKGCRSSSYGRRRRSITPTRSSTGLPRRCLICRREADPRSLVRHDYR